MATDNPYIRVAARAIIHREGRLLVQFYREGDVSWCTTPGGGVQKGERLDLGLVREVHEELGITIRVGSLRYVRELRGEVCGSLLGGLAPDFHQIEHIFDVVGFDGEPHTGEKPDNYATHFDWIALEDLAAHNFFPSPLVTRLPDDLRQGFAAGTVYLGDA